MKLGTSIQETRALLTSSWKGSDGPAMDVQLSGATPRDRNHAVELAAGFSGFKCQESHFCAMAQPR